MVSHACTGDKQKLFRLIKSVQASHDGLSATPLPQRSNASQLQHTDLLDLGSSKDDFLSDFATGFDTQVSPHTLLGHVSAMKPTRAQTTPLSFADLVAQEQIDPNPPKIRVVVRKRPLNDKVSSLSRVVFTIIGPCDSSSSQPSQCVCVCVYPLPLKAFTGARAPG